MKYYNCPKGSMNTSVVLTKRSMERIRDDIKDVEPTNMAFLEFKRMLDTCIQHHQNNLNAPDADGNVMMNDGGIPLHDFIPPQFDEDPNDR